MDSHKNPGGGSSSASSKPSGTVPITVRFNAGDECIDDLFQSFHNNASGVGAGASDSLSSSPSQPQATGDEINARSFLQTNFFNRKRCGSIENISPTSSGPNLVAQLSNSDVSSAGTWKLIKGKVSQTFEEIKLSKAMTATGQSVDIQPLQKESPALELSSDTEIVAAADCMAGQERTTRPFQIPNIPLLPQCGSDSEIEGEDLLDGELEQLRLSQRLAILKSSVKARSADHQSPPQIMSATKRELSAVGANSDTTSLPSTDAASLSYPFIHRRQKHRVESAELGAPPTLPEPKQRMEIISKADIIKKTQCIITGKKEVEIESGVEMLEGMMPPLPMSVDVDADLRKNQPKREEKNVLLGKTDSEQSVFHDIQSCISSENQFCSHSKLMESKISMKSIKSECSVQRFDIINEVIVKFLYQCLPCLVAALFLVVLLAPIPEFIRGALACLLTLALLETTWPFARRMIEKFVATHPPENVNFQIPDYSKLPICEIPPAQEYKYTDLKAYSGWMNEVNSYDPETFHMSMTKAVYVKLEGSMLRVSLTSARIPKRAMWNEPPIDLKTISFHSHRTFSLLNCRIELLPLGLARKRFFNRKYPIQLIVKKCIAKYGNQEQQNGPMAPTITLEPVLFSSFRDKKELSQGVNQLNLGTNSEAQGDDHSDRNSLFDEVHLATTVLNANLQDLQDIANPDEDLRQLPVPCGEEVRLLLFSRCDREKEDWYRRFIEASKGEVYDQKFNVPDIKVIAENKMDLTANAASFLVPEFYSKNVDRLNVPLNRSVSSLSDVRLEHFNSAPFLEEASSKADTTPEKENFDDDKEALDELSLNDEIFEGLIMTPTATRSPPDYLRFMLLFQKACNQRNIPIRKQGQTEDLKPNKRHRRIKRQQDELWKGINQSLYLGPSGSVVWANVLIGRVIYSCLHDPVVQEKLKDLLQKKLSSIKFPSFIEDVLITDLNLGNVPPLIHRVSQPLLDERGIWLDSDVTYEGLLHITVIIKVNLLRVKRNTRPTMLVDGGAGLPTTGILPPIHVIEDDFPGTSHPNGQEQMRDAVSSSVIFDSNAESSGSSSSDSDDHVTLVSEASNDFFQSSPNNARRLFKIVDRFTASHFFQYAAELSYVQRAMENMSTNITLRVDLKGLVARSVLNIPPPPSDRVWLSFRGPPRLWLSAKPAVGDKSFDWTIVTNIIESKLCEAVNKFLVYPNMVDVTIPFLGQPTYSKT